MIEIKGVIVAKVSLSGKSDFIDTEDLEVLKIQEESGNVLPRLILNFSFVDASLEPMLNEGNKLEVSMGTTMDAPDRVDSKFSITSAKVEQMGSKKRASIMAVYDGLKYTNTPSIEVFPKKTSFDVIQDLVSRTFKPKFTLTASEDEPMDWKKAFISDKNMVDHCLRHMWLSTGVPLVGINSKGEYILKSIQELIAGGLGGYKLKITQNPKEDGKDYPWDFRDIEDQRSLSNTLFGYGRSKRVFDSEKGTSSILQYRPVPTFAPGAAIPTSPDVKMAPSPESNTPPAENKQTNHLVLCHQ